MGRVDRKSMSLILQNTVGAKVARFNFFECWPFRWKLSGFDGSTATTAPWPEILDVSHDRANNIF